MATSAMAHESAPNGSTTFDATYVSANTALDVSDHLSTGNRLPQQPTRPVGGDARFESDQALARIAHRVFDEWDQREAHEEEERLAAELENPNRAARNRAVEKRNSSVVEAEHEEDVSLTIRERLVPKPLLRDRLTNQPALKANSSRSKDGLSQVDIKLMQRMELVRYKEARRSKQVDRLLEEIRQRDRITRHNSVEAPSKPTHTARERLAIKSEVMHSGILATIHSRPASLRSESDEELHPVPATSNDLEMNTGLHTVQPAQDLQASKSNLRARAPYTIHSGRVISTNGDSLSSISSGSPPKTNLQKTAQVRSSKHNQETRETPSRTNDALAIEQIGLTSGGGTTHNAPGGGIALNSTGGGGPLNSAGDSVAHNIAGDGNAHDLHNNGESPVYLRRPKDEPATHGGGAHVSRRGRDTVVHHREYQITHSDPRQQQVIHGYQLKHDIWTMDELHALDYWVEREITNPDLALNEEPWGTVAEPEWSIVAMQVSQSSNRLITTEDCYTRWVVLRTEYLMDPVNHVRHMHSKAMAEPKGDRARHRASFEARESNSLPTPTQLLSVVNQLAPRDRRAFIEAMGIQSVQQLPTTKGIAPQKPVMADKKAELKEPAANEGPTHRLPLEEAQAECCETMVWLLTEADCRSTVLMPIIYEHLQPLANTREPRLRVYVVQAIREGLRQGKWLMLQAQCKRMTWDQTFPLLKALDKLAEQRRMVNAEHHVSNEHNPPRKESLLMIKNPMTNHGQPSKRTERNKERCAHLASMSKEAAGLASPKEEPDYDNMTMDDVDAADRIYLQRAIDADEAEA